ncbi:uncharacterized protein VTP21DRAFT_6419 [Calcarisporiella thermophila]|uniref:uncharacterized protein n=1 Tax=Calcarisporiella thermophila TaxID=911321 RepID=UPI003744964A
MKEQVSKSTPKKIKYIQFGVLSPQDVVKSSELEVTHRDLYQLPERTPVKHGVLDLRLGTSDKGGFCETCGLKMAECVGHFGHIKLVLPAFHVGYFRAIIVILQNICKTCSRVMLEEEDRRVYLKRLRAPRLENMQRRTIAKAVNDKCKKVVHCPYCGATNGTVKKVGPLKIIHEKFRAKKTAPEQEAFRATFNTAVSLTPELKTHLSKAQEDLNPLKVLQLFQNISNEDAELLGLDPEHGRPELYIWQYVPVPPVPIRPSVAQDGASTEDDLTAKLTEIIFTNALIKTGLDKGVTINSLMEQWEFLQLSIAMYINSELPGVSLATTGKPIRGLCQRLKGKQGRFRGNLSGKRVDFSGRTVISPDPNMRIDQVAVPDRVAKILTYPERVFEHNIERLRKYVRNGPDVHPGANYVQSGNGFKKYLKIANREAAAADLKIGDIVERHLMDGDVVLFNRQPSLHRMSIMAHFAKVMPWRTFRFNVCCCAPYNADFDGDEMNLHLPQTEEARAEAINLMGIKNNLVTPKNGEPLIAATQDFITSSFLISKKGNFYTRAQFVQICSYLGDAELKIDLPPPAILKPVQLWTGKQIFNVLIRPNKKSPVIINLDTKTKSFKKRDGRMRELCPEDGWLVIYNSELLCGVVDKSIVGEGKNSIFYAVLKDYGSIEAALCMNRLAKLCARFLANHGFSIGINDVQSGEKLLALKDDRVEGAYSRVDELIHQSKTGQLENMPGMDQEQTLESEISGVLSKVREELGQVCMTELSRHNAPLIMAACGSKGSVLNVCQMVACVGQQIISGKRIPDGFEDRSLPHFLKHSKIPPAKGFVRNSFYSGLSPTEFFFHAVSGREGLVDTAVKTAETGYMQRRLMKALEDLTAHYDTTVRNSTGGIVQFTYGSDNLDPCTLEGDGQPVNFLKNLRNAKHMHPRRDEPALKPWQIAKITHEELSQPRFQKLCTSGFLESLEAFIREELVDKIASTREAYGLYPEIEEPPEEHQEVDLDVAADEAALAIVNNKVSITEVQLRAFLNHCHRKYQKALTEPGTAVGAVGAQSIGEPGTQMTLKTFHFAGVASMNITLGVPRIKEIINASKLISTPLITCKLACADEIQASRIVKGRVEKTLLGDIAEYIEEVYRPDESYLSVKIDMEAIKKLQLEISLYDIASAIMFAPKLKIGEGNVHTIKPDKIKVYASSKDGKDAYYNLQALKRVLPNILVKGIASVNRGVINQRDKELVFEGYGLKEVMGIEGIIGTQTTSNHVMEVVKVLGIEAARATIINEIKNVMDKHNMTVDPRHIMLLADVMTYKGEVLGVTRFGVARMKDSVLMLASFEKTTDHLFDAAFYGKKDPIEGVSECIIMGIPMPTGTGLFKMLHGSDTGDRIPPPRKLLFDDPALHAPLVF